MASSWHALTPSEKRRLTRVIQKNSVLPERQWLASIDGGSLAVLCGHDQALWERAYTERVDAGMYVSPEHGRSMGRFAMKALEMLDDLAKREVDKLRTEECDGNQKEGQEA